MKRPCFVLISPSGVAPTLILGVALGLVLVIALSGCVHHSQVQYFEVRTPPDALTGESHRNFYRMTVKGKGNVVGDYEMKSAYLSKAALDTLQGKTIAIPAIDIPNKRLAKFEALRDNFDKLLKDFADSVTGKVVEKKEGEEKSEGNNAPASGTPKPPISVAAQDSNVLSVLRQLWLASLSDSDLISIGESSTLDPYAFRKLVFYVSANVIDLTDTATSIDNALGSLGKLAEALRTRKEAREKEKAQQKADNITQNDALIKILEDTGQISPEATDTLRVIFGSGAGE